MIYFSIKTGAKSELEVSKFYLFQISLFQLMINFSVYEVKSNQQPNIESKALHLWLQKHLKFSPTTHSLKFLYDKSFNGNSFGTNFSLKLINLSFFSKLFVLCIIKRQRRAMKALQMT